MGYPTSQSNIPFIKTGKRTTTIDANTFADDIVYIAVGLYSSSSGLYGVVTANGDLWIKSNTGMTNAEAMNFRSTFGFTGSWQKFKTGVAKVDTGGPYLHVLYKNGTIERYTSTSTVPTNLGTARALWNGINSEFVYVKADGTLNDAAFPTNKNFVAVRIGQKGTMALAGDGTLHYKYSTSVVQIASNVKDMAMSGGSTGRLNYLKNDGTVWTAAAAANPSFGQVTGFPSPVKALVDVVDGNSYALLEDGSVYTWTGSGAAAATTIVAGSGYYSIYGDGARPNTAPNTPPTNNPRGTQASPSVLLTTTPTLDWSFSDTDTDDTQSAYQVKIKDVAAASYVHDTGKVVSTATDYVVPGGVITAGKVYSWEVSTWDTNDLQSAFSSAEYFQVVPPAAVGDKFTFNYTGGGQTFQIPGNVTKVKLEAWGAQGGNVSSATGGKGGYSVGELTTTPGQVLHLYVGGKGGDNISGTVGGTAGYNGGAPGGAGSSGYRGAGGGGGGTDIRIGGTALANRILIAGGGGGGGGGATATYNGGAGGGTAGGDGQSANTGGTQTAGGTSPGNNAQGGTLGQGGQGTNVSSGHGGGSGGGGYYGGAGGLNGHGGGGGSGYVSPTLTNASTTANQRTGDGQIVITILEATDPGVAFVNRSPGTTDQAAPGGTNTAPTFVWDYNKAFTQTKYQVKLFDGATVIHDSGQVTSAEKSYTMPAGILSAGHVYGWEVTTMDNLGSQYPSNRLYFITNYPPAAPVPDPITDNLRVGKRPVFSATVADDVENDGQAFILQLATDSGFTAGLLSFDTTVSTAGWEYDDGTAWQPFPADGKLSASNEGRKIRYTPQADLVEGMTYYWRMAAKDGFTGAQSDWVGNTRIRCGNKFLYTAKTIKTTAPVDRIVFSKFATISDKVTVKLEVTNNAYDAAPNWEDATAAFLSGDYYRFTNTVKTAADWGLAVRLTIDANDELGPIELDAIGYSWD